MPSILDLFSGGGGFSLGAHKAGFRTAVAIDADPILTHSFKANFPSVRLLNCDIRKVDGDAIRALLPTGIDGVIGGPPCQAFSEMGRRDIADPRRSLVVDFFRVVSLAKPKFFVFENVRGLSFHAQRPLLDEGLDLVRQYRIIGPTLLNAADFGAPTRRIRLFVFGFDPDRMEVVDADSFLSAAKAPATVRDAINDLSGARYIEDRRGFDVWAYDGRRAVSEYAKRMRSRSGTFTGNRQTVHKGETVKRFARLEPRQRDAIGKYVRLDWDGLCPTLRAGTGGDRGSYQAIRPLHPSEDRVITARESARLQGFPDSFLFHPTIWHSCRIIGNSVSPILANVLLGRVKRLLAPVAAYKMAAE